MKTGAHGADVEVLLAVPADGGQTALTVAKQFTSIARHLGEVSQRV